MLETIEAGRFGPVYRAQGPAGDELVAIKVLDQELPAEQIAALAAALERLCLTPLDHPSVVPFVTAGVEGRAAYVVERYVEGMPLHRVLQRDGPQPLAAVLLRITQVAGALDFAAAVGVHHGALHPRDILISDETTVLTGLGLVEAFSDAGLDVPVSGAYASPQRVEGRPVARGDDIYALAAITFELVSGRPVGDRSKLASSVTPQTGVDHRRFLDVLEGSLSDDPHDRPSTALQFAAALQRVLVDARDSTAPAGDLPLRQPEPELESESKREVESESESDSKSESEPRWFGVAAALAIGLLTGFAGGFVAGQRDVTPAPRTAERVAPRQGQDFTESAVADQAVGGGRSAVGGGPNTDRRTEPTAEGLQPTAGRPEPTADRLQPTADNGRVLVRSIPSGARVVVDGAPRGVTPLAVRALPLGAHSIEVTYLGYEPRQQRVMLTGDRPAQSIDFELRPVGAAGSSRPITTNAPGALQVDSRPSGARVFVNEQLVGTTPLMVSQVKAGTHAVRIEMPGYRPWATSVSVAPGSRARVAASLER